MPNDLQIRSEKILLYQIKIFGIVQGVGFRPFIDRLAKEFKILGTVANKGSYVEIFAQGDEIENFCEAVKKNSPPRAEILNIEKNFIADSSNFTDFKIIESEHEDGDIFVSPDISICDKCAEELFDKNNRRYLHPFINCTDCGPRLTILKSMPYDRERTSMENFPMCDDCREEYFNKNSRRYDAQPVCCNECGPEVFILDGDEKNSDAIKKIRKIIFNGGIAAIKGIGGFHLACDANNFETVQRLRKLKNRPSKPFAVMTKKISFDCSILNSPQKPIVLIDKKFLKVAENVAPNNNKIGVMLPYTPLHLLIFDYPDEIKNFPNVLIMTSGNISGEPLAINDDDAKKLLKICDAVLTHNREILIRADDSVADIFENDIYMIRRSRGYAPLPIHCNNNQRKKILAIGGELKNTFCLSKNNLFYMSPYIGDLTNLKTINALKKSVERMIELFEIKPEIVVCDLHPRYHSAKIAEEFAEKLKIPLIKIQHHYAHILSCMAENNFFDEVIGVSFDGTGYGTDGTIWGGEFMIASPKNFKRVDSITPFIQAGGDKSSVEGWRNAVSMIYNIYKDFEVVKKISKELNFAEENKIDGQIFLLKNNINCVKSTSIGRLFDTVSAILGFCKESTFEGEAAMTLQFNAELNIGNYELIEELSTEKIFENILKRRLKGEDVKKIAFEFHAAIAEYVLKTCEKLRDETKISTVALSGGVFQNTLLLNLTIERLHKKNFKILRHKMIPPNDGGIALGQALAANYLWRFVAKNF